MVGLFEGIIVSSSDGSLIVGLELIFIDGFILGLSLAIIEGL